MRALAPIYIPGSSATVTKPEFSCFAADKRLHRLFQHYHNYWPLHFKLPFDAMGGPNMGTGLPDTTGENLCSWDGLLESNWVLILTRCLFSVRAYFPHSTVYTL